MKIQVIESKSNRPLANTKVQLQVKGKDSGFISVVSDSSGHITLDDKLSGQQITATSGTGSQTTQWTTATEGARLTIASSNEKASATETTQGGRSTK